SPILSDRKNHISCDLRHASINGARPRPALRSGRQVGRTLRCSRPAKMDAIALVTVGLFACGFILCVLSQWRREKTKRDRISAAMTMRLNVERKGPESVSIPSDAFRHGTKIGREQ